MKTINLKNIRRSIALVSDTHVYSDYALIPREPLYTWKDPDPRWINPPEVLSNGQKILQGYWYDKWLPVCDEFNVDTVIHFGDATQGCNPKEGGIDVLTPDLDYQLDAAEALMRPLVKDRTYHQFSGSKYHEALNTRIHRELFNRLKSTTKKNSRFWNKFGNIKLTGTNKILNCAHAATSALIYPAAVIDRELVFIKVAVAEGKIPMPDYMIRGHLHRYLHLDYPDIHGIQLPGWMSWYALADKVRLYGRTQPDIGFVMLLIDKLDRTILLHFIYPTPKIVDFLTEG